MAENNQLSNGPNQLSPKERAVLVVALASAGLVGLVGVAGLSYKSYKDQVGSAEKAEKEALKSIETNESVKVEDFTLILRSGVNVRKQPRIMMAGSNDKSDANTAWEVEGEVRVKNPLSVHVETDEGFVPYYLIPKSLDKGESYLDSEGKLDPGKFDWVDGRVVGERSNTTGELYAEIAYPDPNEPGLPEGGSLEVTNGSISYQTPDGQSFPVSERVN